MNGFVLNNTIKARLKKTLAFVLALSLLCAFSACKKETPEEETTAGDVEQTDVVKAPAGSVTVPYTSLDSVNPFFCTSVLNSSVLPLVFRSLYTLNSGFTAEPDVAITETATPEAVRVSLPETVLFSDGVTLTSSDVVYSFSLAKDAPLYKEALRNVERCEAAGNHGVVFQMKTPDVNALNVLTFPIVKHGTAGGEKDLPVGAGPFAFEKKEGKLTLAFNAKYSGELPAVGNIVLKNITETSSLMHLLDTDEIDCFYTDLSSGTAKRSASGAGEVYLNNLVFLGVNHGSYQLYTADVRRAISLALSRSLICSNAYMNHARAAFYPVNTSWEALNAGTLSAEQIGDADVRAADALLSVIHAGTKGETLHYRLLCPDGNPFLRSAAALIAEQLAAVNVQLELEYLAMDAFQLALGSGKFDFYLAEIKLTRNMDLSPFFSGGAASYGMKMDDLRSDTTYGLYRSGQVELSEFLDVFASELPFIPLLYRNGQFCYSRHIDGKVESTEENLFRSIAEWEVH